jgi:hypothetical protein
MTLTGGCAGLLALIAATGCGSGGVDRAVVKGKVTYNNKRLTAGTVSFFGPNKSTGSAKINEDGTYEMTDAPVGEVTITVQVPQQPLTMGGGVGMPKVPEGAKMPTEMDPGSHAGGAKIVPIPDKYKDVATSKLTFKVEKGEQEHDIDLPP